MEQVCYYLQATLRDFHAYIRDLPSQTQQDFEAELREEERYVTYYFMNIKERAKDLVDLVFQLENYRQTSDLSHIRNFSILS